MSAAPSIPPIETPEGAFRLGLPAAPRPRPSRAAPAARVRARHLALACVLVGSAVLNTWNLSQNGYANTFYAAAVKSMLPSLHNLLFASFDPGGLITIDKPPLAIWVQTASAKLFGFSPLSLLLPQALIATATVALLYRVIARRLGAAAGLVAALALAVFPAFVAVARENGVDPLLIALLVLACAAALNAIESGRWRALLACAALVGLAFNTKTLAAYLVAPGIVLAYLVCAPERLLARAGKLLVAGLVLTAVSFSWIAFVELTPASQRPYVGGSTNDSELGLTFEYNGLGRVGGESGGPGSHPLAAGGGLPIPASKAARRATPVYLADGRRAVPLPFGRAPGPLRLFQTALADQGAWLLPFALVGLAALALAIFTGVGGADPSGGALARARERAERVRRDPRLATMIVFGGWLLVEVAILSFSKGIVHPYYVSAIGPGAAAMTGAGAIALTSFARRRHWGVALLPCAVAASVAAQLTILHEQHYMGWFAPVLVALAAVALALALAPRLAAAASAIALGALLVAPTVYATTTWLAPVNGTFPAAGPHEAAGDGAYGLSPDSVRVDRALIRYVRRHRPGTRWAVLTVASPTAAPLILMGLAAGALGGYSGTDPALDGRGLARLVARHEARYVVLGGAYAARGGNAATRAVLRACAFVPPQRWHGPPPQSVYTLVLFDCAGRERALDHADRRLAARADRRRAARGGERTVATRLGATRGRSRGSSLHRALQRSTSQGTR